MDILSNITNIILSSKSVSEREIELEKVGPCGLTGVYKAKICQAGI